MNEAIYNEIVTRNKMISRYFDRERDVYTECGLPDTASLTPEHYYNMYDREPIANRVVGMMPNETWMTPPALVDTGYGPAEQDSSEFLKAIDEVCDILSGEEWYDHNGCQPLWELISRADEIAGIGSFGGILYGIDDGKRLSEPATLFTQGSRPSKKVNLLYAQAYYEPLIEVAGVVNDPTNPRHGMPEFYNITINDPNVHVSGVYDTKSVKVHWTRVVHLMPDTRSSRTHGTPRQRVVWNNLLNLQKLYHGSAEMYWQGAFPGLSFETHPELGNVELDETAKAEFKDMLEKYRRRLQRYLRTTSMTVKSIAPQVTDPTPQIERQVEAISIKMTVPKRIFMGSERGELSSGQDAEEWDGKLMGHQALHTSPMVIAPAVGRLIRLGVVPPPKKRFRADWPDLTAMSDNEKATIAMKRMQSASRYMAEQVYRLVSPEAFLVGELGYTPEEAHKIAEDVGLVEPGTDRIRLPSEIVETPGNEGAEDDEESGEGGAEGNGQGPPNRVQGFSQ